MLDIALSSPTTAESLEPDGLRMRGVVRRSGLRKINLVTAEWGSLVTVWRAFNKPRVVKGMLTGFGHQ